jgi:hypothetical protein
MRRITGRRYAARAIRGGLYTGVTYWNLRTKAIPDQGHQPEAPCLFVCWSLTEPSSPFMG